MLRDVRRPCAALVRTALLCIAGFGALAPPDARAQEAGETAPRERRGRSGRAAKPAVPPGMQQAVPLATIGDWNVFTNGQGRARVCYAIAQPQTRSPRSLARDTAYLFVSVRKGENVQNEIAVMFGFEPKPAAGAGRAASGNPVLEVGAARFGLLVRGENAWIENQADEPQAVAELSRGPKAVVRTTSARGNPTADEYALGGFAEALKRAREECR